MLHSSDVPECSALYLNVAFLSVLPASTADEYDYGTSEKGPADEYEEKVRDSLHSGACLGSDELRCVCSLVCCNFHSAGGKDTLL